MSIVESERITSLLRNAIRLSNFTYRDVERQLGWRVGTITRLMRGGPGLKVEHLLSILHVISFSPARFFAAACPAVEGAGPAEDRLYRMLEQMHGDAAAAPAPVAGGMPPQASARQDDIDEMVRTSLRKLIGGVEADSAAGEPNG